METKHVMLYVFLNRDSVNKSSLTQKKIYSFSGKNMFLATLHVGLVRG